MKPLTPLRPWLAGLALGLALITFIPSAHANVYASNIKINGGMTNLSVAPGASFSISYILNEPATAGVTISILSGNTPVRTITLTNGAPGTARGLNTNLWDGTDDLGQSVAAGSYSFSVTAGSTGYDGWTLTTLDSNPGNNIWDPRGIAIDRNTNSPYYGRVFSSNAAAQPGAYLGYQVGILKCNADGSYADEGGFSDGGYSWAGFDYSPWKLQVSDDDYVYIEDWNLNGEVYRWDPTLSPGSMTYVLSSNNWAEVNGFQVSLSGPALWGTGTNTEIWMADHSFNGGVTSLGIIRYNVSADGTCSNGDTGTVMVGTDGDLSVYPADVALDKYHNIYTIQDIDNVGDGAARVLRFAANPATNGNGTVPEQTADWKMGSGGGKDWLHATGLAVDPTGAYLAVSFLGQGGDGGNTKIFSTATGSVLTNLDLGVNLSGTTVKGDYDVDWDAVGNVYLVDSYSSCWRAYSPPGANQSTTKALAIVQVVLPAPQITSISVSGSNVTVSFTGAPNDLASAFALLSSSSPSGPYSVVPGAIITGGGGHYQATAPTSGAVQYYQIERVVAAPQAPVILDLKVSAGTATVRFTGASSDPASAFTLLSSGAVNGTYTTVTNAALTGSSGAFQASAPTSGSKQFYRIRR